MNSQSNTSWRWTGVGFAACDTVPVADRGFRYGMSVFESLPVRRGIPFFLAGHVARLRQACAQSGLETSLPELAAFKALLRSVEFDAFARIYVTAGEGDVFTGAEHGSVFVFVEPRNFDDASAPDGYKLVRHRESHAPILGGLKTGNYWTNILALREARKQQCNEALMFNTGGELISASMANVFIVQEGKIKTPAASGGARAGVIRELVMSRCKVEECRLTENDLAGADEIFLTSSGIGVMPAVSLDGCALRSRDVGLELRVEYQKEIAEV